MSCKGCEIFQDSTKKPPSQKGLCGVFVNERLKIVVSYQNEQEPEIDMSYIIKHRPKKKGECYYTISRYNSYSH